MKKILIACLGLFISFGAIAQIESDQVENTDKSKQSKEMKRQHAQERMASLKVGYLTNELELSEEEAQNFWPIYNKYDAQRKELRSNNRPGKKVDEMSEQEAEAFLASTEEMKVKTRMIDDQMNEELSGVLPASKRLKLNKAEKAFHKKMLKNMKKKRKGKKGKNAKKRKERKENREE